MTFSAIYVLKKPVSLANCSTAQLCLARATQNMVSKLGTVKV